MKILVINGSPKGESSNTLKVTKSFIAGIDAVTTCQIDYFSPYTCSNLHPCCGCYSCWTTTPGTCIYNDDMPLDMYINADIIIWSFPLYYFNMPSQVKCVMDRLLPLLLPFIETAADGSCFHPPRYDLSKKHIVLISTCGFSETASNYAPLLQQFDLVFKDGYTPILCAEGELFRVSQVKDRCAEYLQIVKCAGEEYGKTQQISDQTKKQLTEKLLSPEVFKGLADADWDIAGRCESKAFRLLTQMSLLYNNSYYSHDIYVTFMFTDINENYQLAIYNDYCQVLAADFHEPDIIIKTTLNTWIEISNGKIDRSQALLDGRYKVNGSLELLTYFGSLFQCSRGQGTELKQNKSRSGFWTVLLPLLVFWNVTPFSNLYGCLATLIVATVIIIMSRRYSFTPYDYIACGLGFILAIFGLIIDIKFELIGCSYIVYGCIWGGSCFTKRPLTVYYSIKNYNCEMINNAIFKRTNLYTTLLWAIAFIIAGGASLILLFKYNSTHMFVYSWVLFIVTGVITNKFIRYYPDYLIHRNK